MTLIETLAVVAIIAVLASLLFPAFARAKEGANQTSCLSALHQSFLAVKLYQTEYDGKDVGTVSQMGLPPIERLLAAAPVLKRLSVCRHVPSERTPSSLAYPYAYQPWDEPTYQGGPTWAAYVADHGEASLIFLDLNHNPLSEPLESRLLVHTGLAVDYGGRAFRRVRLGNPDHPLWWEASGEKTP